MKIKTTTTVRAMTPANPFGIVDIENYDEVYVMASGKREARDKTSQVAVSFPRLKTIPMNDQRVVDAIKKCVDWVTEQMSEYLKRK